MPVAKVLEIRCKRPRATQRGADSFAGMYHARVFLTALMIFTTFACARFLSLASFPCPPPSRSQSLFFFQSHTHSRFLPHSLLILHSISLTHALSISHALSLSLNLRAHASCRRARHHETDRSLSSQEPYQICWTHASSEKRTGQRPRVPPRAPGLYLHRFLT